MRHIIILQARVLQKHKKRVFYVSEQNKNRFIDDLPAGERYKCKRRTEKIKLNIIDGSDGEKAQAFSDRVNLNDGKSVCDPSGMYTGIPENEYEQPVQDADDL